MRSTTQPLYDAILWDSDGVLVDTERWYFQATRESFANIGVDLTVELYLEYFLSRSSGASHFAASQGLSEVDIADLCSTRNERYLSLIEQSPIMISGVRETLQSLQPHFKMGIVTSSRRAHFEAIHRRSGLLEYIDFVITLEDCARRKPAPDSYLAAIARSGLPSYRCLSIEDSPRGLAAAQAAKLDCWVIPTGFTQSADFTGATRILRNIAEVASTILRDK